MPPYKPATCPISRFVQILGDAWTWLILREAFVGTSRFSDFQRKTGVAKNILATRMERLVENEVLCRKGVGSSGPRFEYFLTEKGQSLKPLLLSILQWSKANLGDTKGKPQMDQA